MFGSRVVKAADPGSIEVDKTQTGLKCTGLNLAGGDRAAVVFSIFGACGAIFFNFSAPAAPLSSFFGASGGVIFFAFLIVLGPGLVLGPWFGLGWEEFG